MKVKVSAKLNLSLNVYPKSGKYHNIDSIVTSVGMYDTVTVTPRSDKRVTVRGCNGISVRGNSAYIAAKLFAHTFNCGGADISIIKGIPLSSGLGGSSADAAAVIYCMCALYGVDVGGNAVKSVCAQVGSDVNFMLRGGAARMCGKGDDLNFVALPCPMYCVVILFDCGVSSADAYSAWDVLPADKRVYTDNDELLRLLLGGDVNGASLLCGNGLQPAVNLVNDYARNLTEYARDMGINVTMTGSGSAYFVLFGSLRQAKSAAQTLCNGGFNAIVCNCLNCGIVKL